MSCKGKERASEDEMEEGEQQDLNGSSSSRSRSYSPVAADQVNGETPEVDNAEPQPHRTPLKTVQPMFQTLN